MYNNSIQYIFLARSCDKGWRDRINKTQSSLSIDSNSGTEMFYYLKMVLRFKYSKIASFM